jgi:sulfate adenylyltransferase
MGKEQWHRSLDEGVLQFSGKAYAWTIPISFPVAADQAKSLKAGQTVRLTNSAGKTVGTLTIADIFLTRGRSTSGRLGLKDRSSAVR